MIIHMYTFGLCNLKMVRNVKMESGHDFVVLGVHVRVLTPSNGCILNATLPGLSIVS